MPARVHRRGHHTPSQMTLSGLCRQHHLSWYSMLVLSDSSLSRFTGFHDFAAAGYSEVKAPLEESC